MKRIILATASPYRKKIFDNLGLKYETESSDIYEYFEGRPDNPKELVLELSRLKAESVASDNKDEDAIVIGFDSLTFFENRILEKPRDRKEAFDRIMSFSKMKHEFYTGIYLIDLKTGESLCDTVKTDVWFRDIKEHEINKYLDQDPNYTRYATGYDAVGHYSASFIEKIEGNPRNLMGGIPLCRIVQLLEKIGYKIM